MAVIRLPPTGERPLDTQSSPRFYLSLMKRYRRQFLVMMAITGVYSAITAGRLLLSGLLVDGVMVHFGRPPEKFVAKIEGVWAWFADPAAPSFAARLVHDEFFIGFLVATLIIFVIAAVLMAFAFYFKEYFAQLLVARMTVDIRETLFAHLSRQSVAYFNRQRSGDVISRLTNDVQAVQLSFKVFFEDIVQEPVIVCAALAVAFVASPVLFALTLPFYAIVLLPIFRSGRKVVKHGRGRLEKLGLVTEAIEQLFTGIRIVKAFNMERHEAAEFSEKNEQFITSTIKMTRAKARGRATQELLYNLGTAVLLLLGVLCISRNYVDASTFFIFLMALVQAYTPLRTLSRSWNQVQESRGGVQRILEVLRERPLIQDSKGSLEFPGVKDTIEFDGVSFSYDALRIAHSAPVGEATQEKGPAVLHDVSFRAIAGQVVALVGPSGAGKSTLVDLLARFYDPQGGRVLVDGRDIREYRYESYLRAIAIVSQDPFLFHTTIRQNIRYGRSEASDAEVEEAARMAFAHDFILEQPQGYDTVIGDRGVTLSGGQRQRVTIARALLKNAQILILDEATSSLDSQAEKEVQAAIENLIRKRSTFVIAHRLSTIVGADKILVMDEGRIVESGCHSELLEARGIYHALWQSQNRKS